MHQALSIHGWLASVEQVERGLTMRRRHLQLVSVTMSSVSHANIVARCSIDIKKPHALQKHATNQQGKGLQKVPGRQKAAWLLGWSNKCSGSRFNPAKPVSNGINASTKQGICWAENLMIWIYAYPSGKNHFVLGGWNHQTSTVFWFFCTDEPRKGVIGIALYELTVK